jgi:hypothetical protein
MLNCPACGFLYSLLAPQCPACHLPRQTAVVFSAAPAAPSPPAASAWPGLGVWIVQAVVAALFRCLLLVVGLVVSVGLFVVTTLITQLFARGRGAGAALRLPPDLGGAPGIGSATGLDGLLGPALAPSPLPLIRHLVGRLGGGSRS